MMLVRHNWELLWEQELLDVESLDCQAFGISLRRVALNFVNGNQLTVTESF